MTILNTCHERIELGGGRFRHTAHVKPFAYPTNGSFASITNTLGATGVPAFPVGLAELATFRLRANLTGQSQFLHLGKGTSFVRLVALGTANVNGQASGANGWLYPDAWTGADLFCGAYGHRFVGGDVKLKAGHPASFQFRIDDHAGLNFDTLATPDFSIGQPYLVPPTNGNGVIPLTWGKEVQGQKLILTATLPGGNYAGWTLDPTLTLQPAAAAGKDTLVASGANAANNYGVYIYLISATSNKGLISFDASSIPSNAICTSAVLTLYQALAGAAVAWTVTARSIAIGNAAWPEGTKNASAGGAGDSCWNFMDQGGAGTVWAGAAGLATSGTDYEAATLATASGNRSDANGTAYTFTLTPARVQGWFGAVNTNYGLLLTTSASIGGLASSDHTTAAWRPLLVINYTLPAGGTFNPPFAAPFRGVFG
jgi:hypothetical protein